MTSSRCLRWGIMYQVGRSELKDSKSMSLEEFKQFFTQEDVCKMSHLFNMGRHKDESIFRKEIVDKYFSKERPKTTTSYQVGDVITEVNGVQYVYMGNFSQIKIGSYEYSGNLYLFYREVENETPEIVFERLKSSITAFVGNYARCKRYFTKTRKKAVVEENRKHFNITPLFPDMEGSFKVVVKPSIIYRDEEGYMVTYKR